MTKNEDGKGLFSRLRKKLFAHFDKKTDRERGVIFRVKSIDKALEKAVEMGAQVVQPTFDAGGTPMAVLIAPGGEPFGIVERAKKPKTDKPKKKAEKPEAPRSEEPQPDPSKARGREGKPRGKDKKKPKKHDEEEGAPHHSHEVLEAFRAKQDERDVERGLSSEMPAAREAGDTDADETSPKGRVAARRARREAVDEDDASSAKPRSLNMDAVKAVLRDAASRSQAAFKRERGKR